MTLRALPLCLLIATGCATAERPGELDPDAGGSAPADAPRSMIDAAPRPIDAPTTMHPIDAPHAPTTVTLTQVSTDTIAASSLACANDATGDTSKQAYYRVFDLAAMGVPSALAISSVAFAVQSEDGTQTITVNVGTYSAAPGTTLDVGTAASDDWAAGDVTAIATATTSLTPASTGTIVTVPITATIPAASRLIVEVRSPDDTAKNDVALFLGASTGTETTPGFYWSPDCGATPPGTPAELGESASAFIITATGTY